MCRFTAYLGPPITLSSLLTEPTHSLIHQSFNARERDEPLNGDGFGVAYYVPELCPEPAIFRSVSPAWSNSNLLHLSRVTRSSCILAHVRAATQGLSVAETNCHPFSSGRFALVHNGDIGGFRKLRRHLVGWMSDEAFEAIQGTTDSEHLFALFLDQHRTLDSIADPLERMLLALRSAVLKISQLAESRGLEERSYINTAVTDGERCVVLRYTTDAPEHADSLYLNTGKKYVCEDGICHMLKPEDGQETVIVSSERLSEDAGWSLIPVNHFVAINCDRRATVRPFHSTV